MLVTETELKNYLEKYLELSETEDVLITQNGRVIAKLTNPYQDRGQTAKSLFGILPADADIQQIRPYDTLYDMYYDEFEDVNVDEAKERSSAKIDKRGTDMAQINVEEDKTGLSQLVNLLETK